MGKHAQESHIWAGSYTLVLFLAHPLPSKEATMLKSNMRRVNNYYSDDDEPSEHAVIVHPHPLLFYPSSLHGYNYT